MGYPALSLEKSLMSTRGAVGCSQVTEHLLSNLTKDVREEAARAGAKAVVGVRMERNSVSV